MFLSGARETDYPAGEELSTDGEASKVSCMAANSSAGSDEGLDGITVVGCSAEGSVAIPQTVCFNSRESSDTGNTASIILTLTDKNIINARVSLMQVCTTLLYFSQGCTYVYQSVSHESMRQFGLVHTLHIV